MTPQAPIADRDGSDEFNRALKRGVVYTRRWVVSMMLDLADYIPTKDLTTRRVVEPACGDGAFLGPVVERMLRSAVNHGSNIADLHPNLRAFDLDKDAVLKAAAVVTRTLRDAGVPERVRRDLVNEWVRRDDYLLPGPEAGTADLVVGNPPYIRLEHIPEDTSGQYRRRWDAMSGRADLYVGFMQAALTSLAEGGRVVFICPDRWMRNQYGRKLRDVVASSYNLDVSVTLHDSDAFHERVAAYPAVVVLRRGQHEPTLSVDANARFGAAQARSVVGISRRGPAPVPTSPAFTAGWIDRPAHDGGSWPSASPSRLHAVRYLEDRFPALGSAASGTRVAVGVATGADAVFITDDTSLIEPDRQLPLVFAEEVTSGSVVTSGRFLVNPWTDSGDLVHLDDYPMLRRYFNRHAETLRGRHVAKKNPTRWFRTIDKIDPTLVARPKILLPDLKARVHPVLEDGHYYPQHNLFYAVADSDWDLDVLGGLLLSDTATALVEAYSVKMASGVLRVTAQYLRRIRIPTPEQIAPRSADLLRAAFRDRDVAAATEAACAVYGIDGVG